jgi:hypothetical protein
MSDWLTVSQAAEALDFHPNYLRRLLRWGFVIGRKQRNRHWTSRGARWRGVRVRWQKCIQQGSIGAQWWDYCTGYVVTE